MRSMGRPRKDGKKDLPPGLYIYPGRNAYIKFGNMKPVEIGTRDRKEALAIYWEFRKVWDEERGVQRAEEITTQFAIAAKGHDRTTVAAYAKKWREDYLPKLVRKTGGKLISTKTRGDYERMLRLQVELDEIFQETPIAAVNTTNVRKFLARWIGAPKYYNNFKSLLSRVFGDAVAEGLLEENPTADIERRPVAKREVYIPMDHYLAITAKLEDWEARICDLVYLISHRPGDVLRLKDQDPYVRYETRRGRRVVVVSFQATKNEQAIEIVDQVDTEGGIESTLQWFRAWKENQGLQLVKHIVCYPTTSRRRSIGRPISVGYLSRCFAEAAAAAGFAGKYTPRDLRKKGLTDEARIAGKATNKGGHKTQAMREYYVVGGLPQRVRSNLTVLRKAE